MQSKQAVWLAALALLVVAAGCGGGGGGSAAGGDVPTETRDFEFTVTVPNAATQLSGVEFFQNEGLTTPGVRIESSSGNLVGTIPVTSTEQQRVVAPSGNFGLAIHFDASGSMVQQDPNGARFTAAESLVSSLSGESQIRAVRHFTFRHNPSNSEDAEYNTARFKSVDSIDAARAEDERGNSPAVSATYNIIGTGVEKNGSLTGNDHAMLLLTDGENNAEDGQLMPGCTGPEGSQDEGLCGVPAQVVTRARNRGVRVFVAGLGNAESALNKFKRLARDTNAAYVKATQSSDLGRQFDNLAQLMIGGGVVVTAFVDDVTVPRTGNPFFRGWLTFNTINGACPAPAQANADGSTCRLVF